MQAGSRPTRAQDVLALASSPTGLNVSEIDYEAPAFWHTDNVTLDLDVNP